MSTKKITPLEKFDHFVNRPIYSLVVILVITLLTYIWILPNEFVMDDFAFIVDWPLIRDWRNVGQFFLNNNAPFGHEGLYSPLKTVIHAINYHMFGTVVTGHHIFSLLVHGCGVVIVYWLSMLLVANRRVAFITSLFFALHPIHSESIISMVASVDTVGVLFFLLSFGFFVKARREGMRAGNYAGAVIAALVAVFSNPINVSLPLLLVWNDVCFVKEKKSFLSSMQWHWPFFMIVVFYFVFKFSMVGFLTSETYIYNNPVYTFWVMIKACAKYIYLLFAPVTLTHNQIISPGIFSFEPNDFNRFAVISQNLFEPQIVISLILLMCLVLWGVVAWTTHRLYSFCVGWFFICLLPVLNIFPSSLYFSERFVYAGSLAFCLLLGVFLSELCEWRKSEHSNSGYTWTVVAIFSIITFFMLRVLARIPEWRNEMSLYESAVMANDQSALMKTDLGIVCLKNDQPEKAVYILKEALKIRPEDTVTYFILAEALTRLDKIPDAITSLKAAIRLNPNYIEAYYNLAGLYASQANPELAQSSLEHAVRLLRLQGQSQQAEDLEKSFYRYWTSDEKEKK